MMRRLSPTTTPRYKNKSKTNKKVQARSSNVNRSSSVQNQSSDSRNASFQSDCVFQTTKYNWYVKTKIPKLFQLVVDGRWDKVPNRAKKYPREAKFVHAYVPKDTALHRLLWRDTSLNNDDDRSRRAASEALSINSNSTSKSTSTSSSLTTTPTIMIDSEDLMKEMNILRLTTIRALLEANSQAIETTDHIGQTPLHLACLLQTNSNSNGEDGGSADTKSSMNAIQLMLRYSRHVENAFQMQDINGQTPLHCFILSIVQMANAEMKHEQSFSSNNDDHSLTDDHYLVGLVELLVKSCPACVLEMQDRHSKTPADYLLEQPKTGVSGDASIFATISELLLQKCASPRLE
jgi:hypothetical protein